MHTEGKSVVAEGFIRALKNEVYKYMTSVSKNVYIDKLHDIVNKCYLCVCVYIYTYIYIYIYIYTYIYIS